MITMINKSRDQPMSLGDKNSYKMFRQITYQKEKKTKI